MDINKAAELMQMEKECMRRQEGSECPRNCDPVCGCYDCELVQNSDEILQAYDIAFDCIKFSKRVVEIIVETMNQLGFESLDDFKSYIEK